MKAHEVSALKIAHWLKNRAEVSAVLHPALPECPGHDIWTRDFTGSSGLFSFVLNGSRAKAAALVDALELFGIGYSWGGFESLALPVHPEHYRSATVWANEGAVIRLQIGLEDSDDLISDLEQALGVAAAAAAAAPCLTFTRRLSYNSILPKHAFTSATNNSGCSIAAKWPPLDNSFQ